MRTKSSRNENTTSEDTTTTTSAVATPNRDAFFDHLNRVKDRCGAIGYTYVEGIERDEEEDDEDEDDEDDDDGDDDDEGGNDKEKTDNKAAKDYTVEQLADVRIILVTPQREKALKQAVRFVTCGQEGDWVKMFDTNTGNIVVEGIPKELNKIMRKKTFPEKFDAFFALIIQLRAYDSWMYDNEMYGPDGELNEALEKLGNTAKKLMARTDEELGIDAEFTRPGMIRLLEKFEEALASCPDLCLEEHFRWR